MANSWGNNGNSDRPYFGGLQNHCTSWLQPWNEKTLVPWKKSYDQPRQHIKKQRHYFANKDPSSQSYGFSSSHVWMWELDYKKAECQRIDAFKLWCWWYIYTMEYYSAIKKNTSESVLMRWVKLEPIIQSEVSQKDKHQYSILMHIYGILKDHNDNPICRTEK